MHPLYGALALDLRHTGVKKTDHSASRIHAVPLPLEEL
jgi:hypothetical protein